MSLDTLLQHLQALETSLHHPPTRHDPAHLNQLLHDSFTEIGSSGKVYTKTDILRALPLETTPTEIWSQDFAIAEISNGVVLLTYKSTHMDQNGDLSRQAFRSSLWVRTAQGWQIRFHQGTPTEAFEKMDEMHTKYPASKPHQKNLQS